MTAKKKSKRKGKPNNTRKTNRQSSNIIANKLLQKQASQSKKEESLNKGGLIYQTILKYKKWFPLPVAVALIVSWFSYYPQNLIVSEKTIGHYYPLSNALIIHNPNKYSIDDIKVKVKFKGGMVLDGHSTIADMENESNYTIYELNSNQTKSVNPEFIEGYTVTALSDSNFEISISYETPIFYPGKKNNVFKFKTILNRKGDVIYLPD